MTTLSRLVAPVLAIAALALGIGVASAAPGIALVNANVRSGPGTGYGIVDTLKTGEYVIVKTCGANWCNIDHIGRDGYVSRALLRNPYYSTRPWYQFAPKDGVGPGRYLGTPDKPL